MKAHTAITGNWSSQQVYYLQKYGVNFRVLEAAPAVGAAWAARYDSLRLFSPAWASGLPGHPWPGNPLHYPTCATTQFISTLSLIPTSA